MTTNKNEAPDRGQSTFRPEKCRSIQVRPSFVNSNPTVSNRNTVAMRTASEGIGLHRYACLAFVLKSELALIF